MASTPATPGEKVENGPPTHVGTPHESNGGSVKLTTRHMARGSNKGTTEGRAKGSSRRKKNRQKKNPNIGKQSFVDKLTQLKELFDMGLIPDDIYRSTVQSLTEQFFSTNKPLQALSKIPTENNDSRSNQKVEDIDTPVRPGLITPQPVRAHPICDYNDSGNDYDAAADDDDLLPQTKTEDCDAVSDTSSRGIGKDADVRAIYDTRQDVKDFDSFEEFLSVAAPLLWLLAIIVVGHVIVEWILGVDMPRIVDFLLHPFSKVSTFRTGRVNDL